MKNLLKTLAATVAALSLASTAHAIGYDLLTSQAIVVAGNSVSPFYTVQTPSLAESGTAAGLYSTTIGGDADTGFWVKISFDGNPQPVLTSAILKAANEYLLWDSTDLSSFNAGTFDSITLWNSGGPGQGIGHYTGGRNPEWKFQGTSHAALNGDPGTTKVPDGGVTLMLLGAGLTALGATRRMVKA